MNYQDFRAYRNGFRKAARAVLADGKSNNLSEAAFPAYTNPNPLASFLFWERIRRVINHVEKQGPMSHVLDFGCGGGVLLPFLGQRAKEVFAADIDLSPHFLIRPHMGFPGNLTLLDLKHHSIEELPSAAFDLILALDVLEHISNLELVLTQLISKLKPGRELLVSGPTENWLYRLGRTLSGRDYTGSYHVSDIYKIRSMLEKLIKVEKVATLFPMAPLFQILICRRVAV